MMLLPEPRSRGARRDVDNDPSPIALSSGTKARIVAKGPRTLAVSTAVDQIVVERFEIVCGTIRVNPAELTRMSARPNPADRRGDLADCARVFERQVHRLMPRARQFAQPTLRRGRHPCCSRRPRARQPRRKAARWRRRCRSAAGHHRDLAGQVLGDFPPSPCRPRRGEISNSARPTVIGIHRD